MRIALISMNDESYWRSCCFITEGLRDAYKLQPRDRVVEWRISTAKSHLNPAQMAKEIHNFKPHVISFLDTHPAFGPLLFELSKLKPRWGHYNFRFHAYGDFTCKANLWIKWAAWLKGLNVTFACASPAQARLLQNLLLETQNATEVCPFPVAGEDFSFDPLRRESLRKTFGLKPDDFLIVYTGRLTLQKNVLAALRAFAALSPEILARSRFVIAGEFDDLGAPMRGITIPPGGFFALWQDELNSLAPAVRERIQLLRGMPRADLKDLYSAADVYLSLSLQHDEDFGMAPAEAAMAGLPLVLTKWGGYMTFLEFMPTDHGIHVHLSENNGPEFDIADVTRNLTLLAEQKLTPEDRRRAGAVATAKLSVKSIARNIKRLKRSGPQFRDFKPQVYELAQLFDFKTGTLIFTNFHKGSTYEIIYRTYIEPKVDSAESRIKGAHSFWNRKLEGIRQSLHQSARRLFAS